MGGSTAALGSATKAYSMGLLILLAYPVMFLISPLPLISPPPLLITLPSATKNCISPPPPPLIMTVSEYRVIFGIYPCLGIYSALFSTAATAADAVFGRYWSFFGRFWPFFVVL